MEEHLRIHQLVQEALQQVGEQQLSGQASYRLLVEGALHELQKSVEDGSREVVMITLTAEATQLVHVHGTEWNVALKQLPTPLCAHFVQVAAHDL